MTQAVSRLFAVFEGNEFSGKSTLHKAFLERLEQEGIPHVGLREPGGTEMAEEIRGIVLRKNRDEAVDPVADVFLHSAYRRQNVRNIIKPALAKGKWVVSDRFVYSTWCLNVAPHLETNPQLADLFMGVMPHVIGNELPEPVCFYLECPPEVRKERQLASGRELDRYEADEMFQARVAAAYEQIKQAPSTYIIDSTLPIEEQVDLVLSTLRALDEKAKQAAAIEVPAEPEAPQESIYSEDPLAEPTPVEPVEEKPFDLEEAVAEYVEKNIIVEVILNKAELLPYYKGLAGKIVRKIFERTGGDTTIFHPSRVGELNREIHSLFHFHERMQEWKAELLKDEPETSETAA